jgi:hypothetical protein
MCNTISIVQPAVACKSIKHQRQPLIAFHITWTFEVFVENCAHDIGWGRNEARRCDLIGEFATDQPIIICEINIHLDE